MRRRDYELLEKEYEFELLLGVETDTYDVLGIIQKYEVQSINCEMEQIDHVLGSYVGTFEQSYPPYSSARVGGHPLFWWARAGRLDEIAIPTHAVTVYSAKLLRSYSIPLHVVVTSAKERINCLQRGDFRQQEVLDCWDRLDGANPNNPQLPVFTCQIVCSSGTYIRSICHEIGQQLGCGAIAYRITRTRIGDYRMKD
jgi:tRNA pseudouridine55 synthase